MENLGKKTARPRGADSVRVISVVEVTTTVGDGTPGNPMRTVTEYWSLSGERLAVKETEGSVINGSAEGLAR